MPPKPVPRIPASRPISPPTKTTLLKNSARSAAPIQPAITDAIVRGSETFKKRRTGLWAAGVAVIVGAGAIVGAQLKTRQQARERYEGKETVSDGESQSTILLKTATEKHAAAPTGISAPALVDSATDRTTADGAGNTRGASPSQRQISFLEDRRGVLMKQKFDLEKKIERVREKRRREEEIEERRGVSVGGER